MSEELKSQVLWACCLTLCACSMIWGLAWYNAKFYTEGYCEVYANAGVIKLIQKCEQP